MRRILALLIGAVVLAGCTGGPQGQAQTFSESTVLRYDRGTVYFSAADPWRGVVEMEARQGVRRFNVSAAGEVRVTDFVPAHNLSAASFHEPQVTVFFIGSDIVNWSSIGQGNVTVTHDGTRVRVSPRFTYNGVAAYNLSTGSTLVTVAAAPPHPTLRYIEGGTTRLELQSIGSGSFTTGGRGTVANGTEARLKFSASVTDSRVQQVRSVLQERFDTVQVRRATSYENDRKLNDADIIVRTAASPQRVREELQPLTQAGEFGAYLPLPRSGTFHVGAERNINVTQDGVRIDAAVFKRGRFMFDGRQYMVRQRNGRRYAYIQVFDGSDITSIRSSQAEVSQGADGYQYRLPVVLTEAAAGRIRTLTWSYSASGSTLQLDGVPVELRFMLNGSQVASLALSAGMQDTAVRQPVITGGAASKQAAQQEMDRIRKHLTAGSLGFDITLLNVTGPDPQHATTAPPADKPSGTDTARYNGTVPDITGVAPVQSAADDPTIGQQDAPVTIEYFSGLSSRCSFCQRFARQTFGRLAETYVANGTVKLVFRDFPWMHRMADQELVYAEASQCVWRDSPSAYWTWHASMLNHVNNWTQREVVAMTQSIVGVDAAKVRACLQDDAAADEVSSDIQAATDAGLRGSPSFVVSGPAGSTTVVGAREFSAYADAIAEVR